MARKKGNGTAEPTEANGSDSALVKTSAAAAPPPESQLQPVVLRNPSKTTSRFAECAGRTTAGCVAICCCFPCGLLNLCFLAAVRLPAGLCCRILRKHITLHQSKKKAVILGPDSGTDRSVKARCSVGDESGSVEVAGMKVVKAVENSPSKRSPAAEVVEMEEAVWSKFHNSGFWRTPSPVKRRLVTES